MWPDRVSNPGHLTYESGALPTALRGPVPFFFISISDHTPLTIFYHKMLLNENVSYLVLVARRILLVTNNNVY